ncbi:hypothetical protein AB0D89_21505 [Streptomyces luteogriseus]|uniref:hypothetical protein n=1 Tax=Streptomyces TaxID=1883 RepID=UPI0004CB7B6F|nr:hypothetical protein [Streptomyces sp. NRRL S-475]
MRITSSPHTSLPADRPHDAAVVRPIRVRTWPMPAGTRVRLARLAAAEHLPLPRSVVGCLDLLRGPGVEET